MIINFKLEDYFDICDEYADLFEQQEAIEVVENDDCLIVHMWRVVIPALRASFREAEWLANDSEYDDEGEWEAQSSVAVQYEEFETNPEKFISYATCDLLEFAMELREQYDIAPEKIGQLDCYIDTSEFDDA